LRSFLKFPSTNADSLSIVKIADDITIYRDDFCGDFQQPFLSLESQENQILSAIYR
jgi:hypothetical protein